MTTKEVTKKQAGGELAIPEELLGGCVVEGASQSDLIITRMHVFQATSQEQQEIGKFDLGDVVDPEEGRPISNVFMPVVGWKEWTKWNKDQATPVYTERDESKVPAEDLAWGDDGSPPAATESFNFIVLVDGENDRPYLLTFKRTSLAAGRKIHTAETRRGQRRQGPALYELICTTEQGQQGYYARVSVKLVGDPDADMLADAATVKSAYASAATKVRMPDEKAPASEGAKGGAHDIPYYQAPTPAPVGTIPSAGASSSLLSLLPSRGNAGRGWGPQGP